MPGDLSGWAGHQRGCTHSRVFPNCVGRKGQAHRFLETLNARGVFPFVGRILELNLLTERWTQVHTGQGQVVLLSGEAGIGKSRLLHIFKEQAVTGACWHLESRCSPYHQNTAFFPFIELLHGLCDWQSEDSDASKLAKLTELLQRYQLPIT